MRVFFQRGQIFQVIKVLAHEFPALFKLIDLMGDEVKGYYYAEQLTKTVKPNQNDFFEVENVIKSRNNKGVKEYFVKFLFYPNKFNRWIPAENFKQ